MGYLPSDRSLVCGSFLGWMRNASSIRLIGAGMGDAFSQTRTELFFCSRRSWQQTEEAGCHKDSKPQRLTNNEHIVLFTSRHLAPDDVVARRQFFSVRQGEPPVFRCSLGCIVKTTLTRAPEGPANEDQ